MLDFDPHWYSVTGLVLDAVGALTLAWGAWLPVRTGPDFDHGDQERADDVRRRRWLIAAGGSLLFLGFALQTIGNWPRG